MKNFLAMITIFALLSAGATTVHAGSKGPKPFNSGKAFPYIGDDEQSAQFIVEAIVHAIVERLGLGGKDADRAADANEANYYQYARDLAKTLSQLSPSEQNKVWYGS